MAEYVAILSVCRVSAKRRALGAMLRAVLGADEAGIAGAEGHAHDGVVAGGLSLSKGGRDRKSFEAHEQMA
jgi:hypothetical protein